MTMSAQTGHWGSTATKARLAAVDLGRPDPVVAVLRDENDQETVIDASWIFIAQSGATTRFIPRARRAS
jgi:hypothetical protein